MPERNRRSQILLLDFAIVLLAILARPLAAWMIEVLPDCFIAEMGYLCPACGSTRCLLALSRLQIGQAFTYHPLLCILGFYGALGLLALNLGYLAGIGFFRRLFRLLTDYRAIITWAIAYGLFGLLRNIL